MMRIILAEDQPPTARIMRLALEKNGFSVDVHSNGLEALEAVRSEWPDVLVTDIEMPGMSGQELCLKIAEEFPDRSFPIYVVTSVTDLVHRKWTRDIDDLYFIEKPVSIRRLTLEIEKRIAQ